MKGLRAFLSSANFLMTVALLGTLFIMVNYLSSRRYARWDFTRQKMTALSEQTLRMLHALNEPLTVTVFYQPTHRLYELVKDLLGEYERTSPKVKVEYVDPEQDIARAKQLAKQFEIEDLNLVVFQAGSRHKHLSDAELAEYDYTSMQFGGSPRVQAFKGEEAFTSAIVSVTQPETPLVWFTSGHGEKAMETQEPAGLSDLEKYLEQQNMSVQTVTLLERSAVPPDVRLLVIAGPTRRFTESEVVLLQTYLEQGGKLLVLIDPLEDAGLDGLLARWGVALGLDVVVDPVRQLPFVSAANLFVTAYTEHPIVKKMKTLMTLYPLARSVRPTQPVPEGLSVTALAVTSEAGWGETNPSVPAFHFDEGQDLKGPVSIAVASERLPAPAAPNPTRLVVIGDSDFTINAQLGNVGNRDFLLGAVYWLTEQEQRIGIGPKPLEAIKLTLTGSELTRIFWFSFLAMPLVCGMLGVGMWLLRRK